MDQCFFKAAAIQQHPRFLHAPVGVRDQDGAAAAFCRCGKLDCFSKLFDRIQGFTRNTVRHGGRNTKGDQRKDQRGDQSIAHQAANDGQAAAAFWSEAHLLSVSSKHLLLDPCRGSGGQRRNDNR
ncbi:hypothetical protein QPK87_29980 [Kamptonema cortianum]|nr:hypothetical protein [Kamptonema cortianum]